MALTSILIIFISLLPPAFSPDEENVKGKV
jgi:hypothetical protein